MAEIDKDHPAFDNAGPWPRLLLHVKTMTPYRWKPGNIYGSSPNPAYNALSYTWGYFEIEKDADFPNVKAIAIQKAPWTIPRIRPDHFEVGEFEDVIKRAVTPEPQGAEGTPSSTIEFLWLDVACIDQREKPRKYLEVGRQARIFRNAQNVYVWLSHLDEKSLVEIYGDLVKTASGGKGGSDHYSNNISNSDWPVKTAKRTKHLVQDPWFSSLWTLQEAFIGRHAIILSKGAMTINTNPPQPGPLRLNYLSDRCDILLAFALDCLASLKPNDEKCIREIIQHLTESGLPALAGNNPMAILAVAKFRKTTVDVDRVYAIMQIFGDDVQVGKAKANGHPQKNYKQQELEDELGALLLEKTPTLSQLHVYDTEPPIGKGWRLSSDSRVPLSLQSMKVDAFKANHDLQLGLRDIDHAGIDDSERGKRITMCKLANRRHNNTLFGYLEGRVCPYYLLLAAWRRQIENYPSLIKDLEIDLDYNPASTIPRHADTWYLGTMGLTDNIPAKVNAAMLQTAETLAQLDSNSQFQVFLLAQRRWGRFKLQDEGSLRVDKFWAMILRLDSLGGSQYWKRLGICSWSVQPAEEQKGNVLDLDDILLAKGKHWSKTEGLFS